MFVWKRSADPAASQQGGTEAWGRSEKVELIGQSFKKSSDVTLTPEGLQGKSKEFGKKWGGGANKKKKGTQLKRRNNKRDDAKGEVGKKKSLFGHEPGRERGGEKA